MPIRRRKGGHVYFIKVEDQDLFKIGGTGRDPKIRLSSIGGMCPYPVILYAKVSAPDDWKEVEECVHEEFRGFKVEGKREWFNITSEQVDEFLARDILSPKTKLALQIERAIERAARNFAVSEDEIIERCIDCMLGVSDDSVLVRAITGKYPGSRPGSEMDREDEDE